MALATDLETVKHLLGDTVDMVVDLLNKGYTANDIYRQTQCDEALLISLMRLLNKNAHAVEQFEHSMNVTTRQLYGSYMDVLEPLLKQRMFKSEDMDNKEQAENGQMCVECSYQGEAQEFTGNREGKAIPLELLVSELKCFRQEVMSYLETLLVMNKTGIEREIQYCHDNLLYVNNTLELVEVQKESAERRRICDAIMRNRYEIRKKRLLCALEDTEQVMRLKEDTKWLESLEISASMSAEEITLALNRLDRMALMGESNGNVAYIKECEKDLQLVNRLRCSLENGMDEKLQRVKVQQTLAENQKTRFKSQCETVKTVVQTLSNLQEVEILRLHELERKLAQLEHQNKCDEQ